MGEIQPLPAQPATLPEGHGNVAIAVLRIRDRTRHGGLRVMPHPGAIGTHVSGSVDMTYLPGFPVRCPTAALRIDEVSIHLRLGRERLVTL